MSVKNTSLQQMSLDEALELAELYEDEESQNANASMQKLFQQMANNIKALTEENVLLQSKNINLEGRLKEINVLREAENRASQEKDAAKEAEVIALQDKLTKTQKEKEKLQRARTYLQGKYMRSGGLVECRNGAGSYGYRLDMGQQVCSIERALGVVKKSLLPECIANDNKEFE